MAIKFIDLLSPNGKSFCIADANDIKGGLHYAADLDALNNIHSSRLVNGTQCYVQSEKKNYVYNDGKWSAIDTDNIFNCTTNSIQESTVMTGSFGNLSSLTRKDLENMSINDILTRALFKEQLPEITYNNPTLSLQSYEVGTLLGSSISITTVNNTIDKAYLRYSYTLVNGAISTVEYKYTSSVETKSFTVAFGVNPNVYNITYKLDIDDTLLQDLLDLKGKSINDSSLILTSWGRTVSQYNTENKTNERILFPTDPFINQTINYGLNGYYIVRYYEGNEHDGDAIGAYNDYTEFIAKNNFSTIKNQSCGKITSINATTLTIDGKTANSSFVYVFIPQDFEITEAKMKNTINNTYESTPFGLVSSINDYITNTIYSFDGKYKCNVYYIAKGDPNDEGLISPSNAPVQIIINKRK